LLIIFTTNLSALVYLNGSDQSYGVPKIALASLNIPPTGFTIGGLHPALLMMSRPMYSSKVIEYHIKSGGIYICRSNGDFSQFLGDVEAHGLDISKYELIEPNLKKAIINMEEAEKAYIKLVREAEKTPYIPVVIDKLKKFGYEDFCKKYSLRADVLEHVKSRLSNGEVTELYNDVLLKCKKLLADSRNLENKIDSNRPILESDIWNLSESYADAMAFGRYVAQIFGELNKELK
jgi:hypothetical protein